MMRATRLALLAAFLFSSALPAVQSSTSLQLPSRGRPAMRSTGILNAAELRDTSCRHGRSPSPDPGDRYPSPTGKDSRWRFELSIENSPSSEELPQPFALRNRSPGTLRSTSVDI